MKRARIAAIAGLLMLTASTDVCADPSYAAWKAAHERMLARWRHSEPRCGWTVGGYSCGTRPLRHHLPGRGALGRSGPLRPSGLASALAEPR